jgi:hypothetical protein
MGGIASLPQMAKASIIRGGGIFLGQKRKNQSPQSGVTVAQKVVGLTPLETQWAEPSNWRTWPPPGMGRYWRGPSQRAGVPSV